VLLSKYYSGDQIMKDCVVGVRGTHGEEDVHVWCWEKPERKTTSEIWT
jgi:hypothetical protein